ncbi:MAG: hypothetical protein ACI4EF_05670 [Coprococcus sp.]
MGLDKEKNGNEMTEEEIINEYLDNIDIDTDGIWAKIEAGLDTSDDNVMPISTNNKKKKITGKLIGVGIGIAALVMITLIAAPILNGNIKEDVNGNVSYVEQDSSTKINNENKYYADKANGVGNVEEENDMQTDSYSNASEALEKTYDVEYGTTSQNVSDGINAKIKIVDIENGKVLCRILYIDDNEFSLEADREIYIIIDETDETLSEYSNGMELSGIIKQTEEKDVYTFFGDSGTGKEEK